jgi:hypothetical protein
MYVLRHIQWCSRDSGRRAGRARCPDWVAGMARNPNVF